MRRQNGDANSSWMRAHMKICYSSLHVRESRTCNDEEQIYP